MKTADNISVHGDSGPFVSQTRRNVKSQVYQLREWLLLGNPVDCRVAGREMAIGSLPRRILDCKQYLSMNIQSRWKQDKNKFGNGITIREYFMTPEDIDDYIENNMHIRMPWDDITRERQQREKNRMTDSVNTACRTE